MLKDMVRSMICHFTLLDSLWGEIFKTAIYILNRLPTKITIKISYEFWIEKKFNLEHLYIWECQIETRPYRPNEKKVNSMMVSCYFIGYSERSRNYKFFDFTTKSIFEIENARFFKDVEFVRKDTVRNFVFEEEYVNIFTCVIDFVQDLIPYFDHDTTN